VRLRDVADIELAAESTDMVVTFNGEPGTFIGVFPTPGANPLDMSRRGAGRTAGDPGQPARGHDRWTDVRRDRADRGLDQRGAPTILEATLIVSLIILLFLGSIRSVLMPLVAIPLSLWACSSSSS
jgi:multidrug efflux pump